MFRGSRKNFSEPYNVVGNNKTIVLIITFRKYDKENVVVIYIQNVCFGVVIFMFTWKPQAKRKTFLPYKVIVNNILIVSI